MLMSDTFKRALRLEPEGGALSTDVAERGVNKYYHAQHFQDFL